MKRTVWLWELFGFAVVSLLGTLLHFLYDFSGRSLWAAPFSGVNESTFEHMKLLFWPMFIFAIVESFFFEGYECFFSVKLKGTLIGLLSIPILFYSYNGIIGKSPDFVNIAIFFISAAIAFLWQTRELNKENSTCASSKTSLIFLTLIAVAFIIFTFKTPELEIFRDPLTGAYGIPIGS